jgi:hypothetical protein
MTTLNEEAVAFFERIVVDWDPEWAIPAAEAIGRRIAEEWPREGSWDPNFRDLASAVAKPFRARADTWNQLVRAAGIYFHAVDVHEDHPKADKSSWKQRAGEKIFSARVPLAAEFLIELINGSEAELRRQFLREPAGWWPHLTRGVSRDALARMVLDADDLLALLPPLHEQTKDDLMAGEIQLAVRKWGEVNVGTACLVVEGWVRGDRRVRAIPTEYVQMLAEGVVRATGAAEWRDRMIGILSEGTTPDEWGLAARLACFAWPDPNPPASERHRLLLEHIRKMPAVLARHGLDACARDARTHPAAALRTAVEIRALAGGVVAPDVLALHLAWVARQAALGLRDCPDDTAAIVEALPELVATPPVGRDHLDGVLWVLATSDEGHVYTFLRHWLTLQATALGAHPPPIDEAMPLLAGVLGGARLAVWLLEWMVDPNPVTRSIAAALHQQGPDREISEMPALTNEQALALAHQLLSLQNLRPASIGILLELIAVHEVVRGELGPAFLDELPLQLPGATRVLLDARLGDESRAAHPAARELLEGLRSRIEGLRVTGERQNIIPELNGTMDVEPIWNELFQRKVREEHEAIVGAGRSLAALLATRVPIARGAQSRLTAESDEITPFQEIRSEVEYPILPGIDPIGDVLRRRRHLERVAKILDREGA